MSCTAVLRCVLNNEPAEKERVWLNLFANDWHILCDVTQLGKQQNCLPVNVFHLFWALSFETKPQEKGLGKVKTKQTPARVCA